MAINTDAKIGDGGKLLMGLAWSSTNTSVATNEATSNYTQVAQVLSFNPSLECEEKDVTHMASGGVRQFIPGHLSATVQARVNLVPTLTAGTSTSEVDHDNSMVDVWQAKTVRKWMLQIPQATNATTTSSLYSVAYFGFIRELSMNVVFDEPNTADVTFRVSDSTVVDQDAD